MNGIISRSSHHRGGEILVGAENINLVTTPGPVHLKGFDIAEGHQPSCPGHHRIGDDEGIGNGSPDDHQRIDTGASVNRNRTVLKVAVTV